MALKWSPRGQHAAVQRKGADPDAIMASEPTLSSLAEMAAAASGTSTPLNDTDMATGEPTARTKEQLRRHYIRALHKVIDESDIVLLVLDARDPEGCRSRLVEEEVRRREGDGKRLVFVLNKIGTNLVCPSIIHQLTRGCRLGAQGECSSVAALSTAHDSHFTVPQSYEQPAQ